MKNKTTAALLALFLGGIFGVHKFYLGRIWQGVLYILFNWTFIPFVISIIEFFILITMSDEKFNMKYNNLASVTQKFSNEEYDRKTTPIKFMPLTQEEIDYANEKDWENLFTTKYPDGSMKEMFQNLAIIYVESNGVVKENNEFQNLQRELNKLNVSITYPKVNYEALFNTYLNKDKLQ